MTKPLPQTARLGPVGHYAIPTVTRCPGLIDHGGKGLVHVQMVLVTGHELDIPLTQNAIDELYRVLDPICTKTRHVPD